MMEMEFLLPEVKRRKLIENGDVGIGMELDDLPEGILLHILSFLSIKEAIKTSVLSRRWRYLWPRMPRLVIEHDTDIKIKAARFMSLVDKAFIHRDSSSIESFYVRFGLRDDRIEYHVRTWIMGAVRYKVQKLFIACHLASAPFCVFTCKTLIELHLHVSTLKLPSSICLPSLKVFYFKWVKFVDSLAVQKLFSLPNLEEVDFYGCDWKDLSLLNISAPKLRKLSIKNCDTHNNAPGNFQILVNGGKLKCFEFAGRLNYDICISPAFFLDSATIEIGWIYYAVGEQFGHHVHKLLMGLFSTKFLSIPSIAIEALLTKSDLLDSLPLFFNLKKLKIQGQRFNFDCQAPLAILTKFPFLETLIFHKGIKLTKRRKKYKWILEPFPLCFFSELKNITICEFDYVEKEIILLVILLGMTKVLKEMVIHASQFFRQRGIDEDVVVNQLKRLGKWSEDCSIIFKPR